MRSSWPTRRRHGGCAASRSPYEGCPPRRNPRTVCCMPPAHFAGGAASGWCSTRCAEGGRRLGVRRQPGVGALPRHHRRRDGEPGCADGHIIRKLLRAGARNLEDFKGFGVEEDMPNEGPFRSGWFGWEPFRLAFVERQRTASSARPPLAKRCVMHFWTACRFPAERMCTTF